MGDVWYLRDSTGRYYTGGAGWSEDRSERRLYRHRWLVVMMRKTLGGYIYAA